MNKSSRVMLAVALLIVAAVVIFVAVRTDRSSPQPPTPVETPPAQEPNQQPEPATVQTPDQPAASTDSAVEAEPEPLQVPETRDLGATLIPVPQQKEPEVLDPECAEFLRQMREKTGSDRIKTMTCKIEMAMDMTGMPQGPQAMTMKGEMIIEMPNKINHVFDVDTGRKSVKFYQISDGVFMEMGNITPDGKRVPMQMKNFDKTGNSSPVLDQDLFDPKAYTYEEFSTVQVDPADYLFQKDDGAPLDNLSLVRLKAHQGETNMEMFVDPASMEMRAMRSYKGDALAVEMSHFKWQEFPDGIMLPASYEMITNMSALGAGVAGSMKMKLRFADMEINPPVDESAFRFTSNPKP